MTTKQATAFLFVLSIGGVSFLPTPTPRDGNLVSQLMKEIDSARRNREERWTAQLMNDIDEAAFNINQCRQTENSQTCSLACRQYSAFITKEQNQPVWVHAKKRSVQMPSECE